ncbi:hypothetical protein [Tahibacter soli]|uniref:Uncharacterized protein n=1 Tax=Tahibacter soli TaxID=2983605 RepID=A0A9X4BIM6_9GAMM|nr:hypothetical protein [Tahibacter soli]MDC8015435.1 hypothetical protein [Tahibacter soli]
MGLRDKRQKKWKQKAEDDVKKIAETARPYALIYFISNQAIRDKDRADTEDSLKVKYGIAVRILDRTWIVDKVVKHKRWQLVADILQFELQHLTKVVPGPLDTERLNDLDALDKKIEQAADGEVSLEVVEESLQTALLARGLGRARTEVDGRFDRAERLARSIDGDRQLQRIWYQRALTAIWWFDDAKEAIRLCDALSTATLESEWIWDLDKLVNLWLALVPTQGPDPQRTSALRKALQQHAEDTTKETSSLWARTQLLLMDLVIAFQTKQDLEPVLSSLRDVLGDIRRLIEFPVGPIVKLLREIGGTIGEFSGYDALLDRIIEIETERHGELAAGELRLERGLQKLDRKKFYGAIDDLAKAQFLLAKDEVRDEFIVAQAAVGVAYESVGLLFAARANLVFALDRCLYAHFKQGKIDPRALPIVRKLAWLELQLGRAPYVMAWVKWLPLLFRALSIDESKREKIEDEVRALDRVLGILVLKTPYESWAQLTRLPDVLHSLDLQMSRAAALFMLGHDELIRTQYSAEDDLEDFFNAWIYAQAADDLPESPSWHIGVATMTTVVLGCRVDVIVRGGTTSALLGESIISFLEAFYSTAVRSRELISPRAELTIEVRQSDTAKLPFSLRAIEDEFGETKLLLAHPIVPATALVGNGFQDAMFDLLAQVTAHLQLNIERKVFEELFSEHQAQDRAFHAARSILAVSNIFDQSPPGRAEDWVNDPAFAEYPLLRQVSWQPRPVAADVSAPSATELTFADEKPPETLFGADALKHRDIEAISPINIPLWSRAGWTGVGIATVSGERPFPIMVLAFQDIDAGRKIFRGWRKYIGPFDREGWIGVTVITGISRERPLDYRVAIGVGEKFLLAKAARSRRLVTTVYRMHDMTPASAQNLGTLLKLYKQAGRIVLQPGNFKMAQPGIPLEQEDIDLEIELSDLSVVPAWEVDASSPLVSAMFGIDDPFVPAGVIDPPFAEVRRRLRESKHRAT